MNLIEDDARSIFLALLVCPPEQRNRRLDEACGGNGELRARVDELLRAHDQMGSIHVGAGSPLATIARPSVAEQLGTQVGPYKLLQQIGEGGMGMVFMAEQMHPVQRKVAVKIIKPGMDTRQVIARFEAERQALALMDHPNIAKVFDAGTTGDISGTRQTSGTGTLASSATGRPYFVMELVKGVPITQYCDEKHLTLRERLELFIPVCQAIQHAHQKGIIHRDLKPSNVLVAEYDEKPVAKIIDFGVAKAVGQRLTEKTMFTEFGQVVGTIDYMSPEQAKLNQLDIDTRSDIYSLGVLLYELLTGETPFDRKRLQTAAFDEMLRIIREEEPPKPSTRLSELSSPGHSPRGSAPREELIGTSALSTLATIAAKRHLEPEDLPKLLRGELDWIVMKCLEKERARRYETASSLARDVEHYLADEPVQACPPSAAYRFRKFARRYKAALVTATTFLVAVVLTLVGLLVSTAIIARQQQATATALKAETKAKDDLEQILERERRESYFQRITLAHHELLENNLLKAEKLLDQCPAEFRAWEWYYLKRLRHVEPVTARGQPGAFQTLAFSSDGQRLALAGDQTTVKISDAVAGQKLLTIPDTGEVACAAFRPPDGYWLVTGDRNGVVKIWDISARQVVRTLGRHTATVRCLTFSRDGRYVASASEDKTVKVWDATTGSLLHDLKGVHTGFVVSVAFSPDGQRLASAGYDTIVRIWDMATGKPIHTLRGHRNPVWGMHFSPDGRRLASASLDGSVRIWDETSGEETFVFDGHALPVTGVAFIDGGRRLASVGHDRTLKIWDPTTGRVVLTLRGHIREPIALACSPDGRRLASAGGDGITKIWDSTHVEATAGQESLTLSGHTDRLLGLAFSPDGHRLATTSWDETVRLWDSRTGAENLVFRKHVGIVLSVAFSPSDGRHIASGGVMKSDDDPSPLKVWDATSGEEIRHFRGAAREAIGVAFSPDARWIATGDNQGAVSVWDTSTGQVAHTLSTGGMLVFGLAFSPDGRRLASLSSDGRVTVFDATDWGAKPLLDFHAHKTWIRGANLAFSPDGTHLVMPGDEYTVNIWDLTINGARPSAPVLRLCDHTSQVVGVAFSHDGRWVASGSQDNTVKLWNAKTGELKRTFRGHAGIVSRVAFSPVGRRLASASFDKTVKVWDLSQFSEETGQE
jgi:WD40 repeat protein/serine/threonine protein kinase